MTVLFLTSLAYSSPCYQFHHHYLDCPTPGLYPYPCCLFHHLIPVVLTLLWHCPTLYNTCNLWSSDLWFCKRDSSLLVCHCNSEQLYGSSWWRSSGLAGSRLWSLESRGRAALWTSPRWLDTWHCPSLDWAYHWGLPPSSRSPSRVARYSPCWFKVSIAN